MSHPGFVITPYDPSDESQWNNPAGYELDAEDLSEKLKMLWPLAEISTNRDGFVCYIPSKNEAKLVSYISDLTATCPRFPEDLVVEFIKWYRQCIPNEISLYLFSFDPDVYLLLTKATTKNEVEAFVEAN